MDYRIITDHTNRQKRFQRQKHDINHVFTISRSYFLYDNLMTFAPWELFT